MKTSAIGWTDFSGGDLNFITGCTKVSEGCRFCYGEAIYKRFGRDFSQVTVHPEKLERLAKKRFPQYSPKRGAPHRPMCFVVDTGDLFQEDVPDSFIGAAFEMMDWRPDVIWQVLTKRPRRMMQFMRQRESISGVVIAPEDNLWLGVSVEDQATADERIPLLLETPAAMRFVSIEPCLERIDLTNLDIGEKWRRDALSPWLTNNACLDIVIVGAESGPNRRPFETAWAEDIYQQCRAAGVAFFGKQDSDLRPGKRLLIDGRVIHEWPEVSK